MADPTAERESVVETFMEKIEEKFHGEDSSSSDDSETDVKSPPSSAVKTKIYRLFGREEPLHKHTISYHSAAVATPIFTLILSVSVTHYSINPSLLVGQAHSANLNPSGNKYYYFDVKKDGAFMFPSVGLERNGRVAFSSCRKFEDALKELVLRSGEGAKGLPFVAAADIFLWRQKKITAGVLGVATSVWVLFEVLEYHLLTLVCHILIVAFTILFLWSNACTFINKAPPRIPEVEIPENIVVGVASAFRIEVNRALALIHETASGKDLKKFLAAVAGLWILSIVGGCCHFLTLLYTSFVLLHTVPVLYEKYEDQVDSIAEKAEAEIKKLYVEFNVKVLSKIPIKQSKEKKFA
ncbi:hypothetical protein LguiB_015316 [Lonicera macranthoides]